MKSHIKNHWLLMATSELANEKTAGNERSEVTHSIT